MSKNRPLAPLHINLLALAFAIAIVTLIYLAFGRGWWLQVAMALFFSIPWVFQFLLLAVAVNARRTPPPYVSRLTFSVWAGAMYPLITLSAPPGLFPTWFIVASAPAGFLLCYLLISVFSWMMTLLPPWRFPWTKNT